MPAGLKCSPCTLQWHWQTNNNWGAISEVWRQCSDIEIGGDVDCESSARSVIIPVPEMTEEELKAVGYKP